MKGIGEYVFEGDLGSGSIGRVRLARSTQTERQVAIKSVKKQILATEPGVQSRVQREIALMRLFQHPNILGLNDVIDTEETIFLIEQFASRGSLFDRINSVSVSHAFHFFRQLIDGLQYLHQYCVCHRDLKPENLLLDIGDQLLIADFGLACWMKSSVTNTSCGSPHYTAPEVISGHPYNGCVADIWSSGVILFAMLAVCLVMF
jgi:BR serine/threonine kinase